MNRRERKAVAKLKAKQVIETPINLVRVTSEELRANRCSAYKYLIP